MANVRGVMTTNNVASQNLVVDMSDKIIMLDDKAKLIKLIMSLGKKVAKNFKFNWQTDQLVVGYDQVSGAVADQNDDTIPVDNGDRWKINDVIRVASGTSAGEIMRVLSISGNILTVTRNVAGSGTSMADNDYLVRVSSSWGENSTGRDSSDNLIALQTTLDDNYNYTQVSRTFVGLSNTEDAMATGGGTYSGDERKRQQAKAAAEHLRDMNVACYLGKRAASGNVRYTGGFDEFITRTSSTSSLTMANIDADMATFSRYGNEKKRLFTTRRVAGKLTQVASAKIQVNDSPIDKVFGARIRSYVADSGEFDIIVDDCLTDLTSFAGYGYFLDLTDVAFRHLPGRDTKLHMDAQMPDQDGKVDHLTTEWGLQRGHASHHGKWDSVAA